MSDPHSVPPDPSMIGGVPKAPFVRLPDPATVFARRAKRLRMLATGSYLASYLEFLAAISDAQSAILPELSEIRLPPPEFIARARRFEMPPLDRNAMKPDAALHDTCRRLFAALVPFPKPEAAQAALGRVRALDDDRLDDSIAAALGDGIPAHAVADHVYVTAALQVHFARLAAQMDANAFVPVGVGLCPVCGGRPVVSLVVGWYGAEGTRYASCMLCSTLWNEVRVKCLACGSTKGVGYQEIEGLGGTIKAETCDACGGYVKVLYEHKDPALDPVADDVASLGLDQLLRESAYGRAGINPFLAGY
ncbi:MAG TPA: formate dehydrogenase accessory protein FdhE [Rhizomicrobium sp.]|nr:formate dehydrogenase accessory protein FdhE [Rhizomicrobium sp.]